MKCFSRRVFSKSGYAVALVARGADSVKKLADELNSSGGEVSLIYNTPGICPLTLVLRAIEGSAISRSLLLTRGHLQCMGINPLSLPHEDTCHSRRNLQRRLWSLEALP